MQLEKSRLLLAGLPAVLVVMLSAWSCGSDDPGAGNTATDGDSDGDTDGDADGDADGDTDTFDECASVGEEAHPGMGPVDIIFAIDNSPSLEDEIEEVRANMNAFSQQVIDAGIDAHIIVISCLPGDCGNSGGGDNTFFGICIDPPLGAADGCQEDGEGVTDDNNPPRYTHVSTRVPSVKGLRWIVEQYPNYQQALRPGTTRHIVVVSDDTDEWTAAQFTTELLALDPAFAGFFFHGVFSYRSKEAACAMDPPHACCEYAAPGGEGVPYKELVAQTGGESGDLCLQDFDPVFAAVATSVIDNAVLSCEYEIPPPPEDQTFEQGKVNVEYIDGDDNSIIIGHVGGPEDCDDVSHGWYYDDPDDPQWIIFCPQTCDWIQGNPGSSVYIQFGCETEDAIPE
jgi:hypothetical protein